MKKKFLACVIASAMLLMGTGYAYWIDAFQLNGTVDTGDLSVKLTSGTADSKISDYLGSLDDNDLAFRRSTGSIDTKNIDAKVGVSAIDFSLNEMYPGYGQSFTFTADNMGTVAAKLSSLAVSGNDLKADNSNKELLNEIGINLQAKINDVWYIWCPCLGMVPIAEYQDPVAGTTGNDFNIKYKSGRSTKTMYFTKLNGLKNINTSKGDGEFLYLDTEVKKSTQFTSDMTIVVTIAMDPDAKGVNTSGGTWNTATTKVSDSLTENQTQDFALTFNWDQYNANKPANPGPGQPGPGQPGPGQPGPKGK